MVSMFYAMREALAMFQDEGLAASWARHQEMHLRLWLGLAELGLEPYVESDDDRCGGGARRAGLAGLPAACCC